VLGYFKEKRVRNDPIYYTESTDRDGVMTREVKLGYVMKNDPFRKQMLVSPVVVPIEEGKFLDDQLDRIDLTTISYFQLRPGKHEETSKKKVTFQEETEFEEDTDDEDGCNIRTELPSRKKPKLAQKTKLFGGPTDPFENKPEGRVTLVSIPIRNGVAVRGDIVSVKGTVFSWRVNGIFLEDSRSFIEVEKENDPFFKSTVPLSYIKKDLTLPLASTPDVPVDNNYAKVYWAYSNLKHLLMHFYTDHSRVRDFKKDIAPSCPILMHAFGIPAEGGSVTYSLKAEGEYSTAAWDIVLGHEWDKVADGTACVTSLKFKVDKTCSLNFHKIIYVHVALVSNVNYKTMSSYRSHAKEKITKNPYFS